MAKKPVGADTTTGELPLIVENRIKSITYPQAPYSRVLVLGPSESVPANTPANTVIIRKEA